MANLGGNIVTIVVNGFILTPQALKVVFNTFTTTGRDTRAT